MSEAAPLLEVEGLRRHFVARRGLFGTNAARVRAVDDVSFAIAAGQTLGLVGESGCGKSTIARLVLGLDLPDRGRIVFGGRDVVHQSEDAWHAMRKHAQMIFQDPLNALDPRISVGKQIVEPLVIHRLASPAQFAARLDSVLAAVGLSAEIAERYPHEVSGGQQQRIVIARALILEPSLVICDEPVSALDVSVQAQVVNLLARLQSERGIAYLFISHDLKIVRHLSHRIAVMYLGKLVEQADRVSLFREPLHPYTRALIAAVPIPDPARRHARMLLKGDPPSPINPPSGCRFHTRCPVAEARCRVEEPMLRHVGGERFVACHLVKTSLDTARQ